MRRWLVPALLLSACNFAPPNRLPAPPVPAAWPTGPAFPEAAAALPVVRWQELFRDPRLRTLITRALADNRDLRIAVANVAEARALYRQQRAALFPTIGIDASAAQRRTGSAGGGGLPVGSGGGTGNAGGRTFQTYALSSGVSGWELDLWGRLRNLSAAARGDYLATAAGARTTRLSLVGEVASAWLALAADRSLLAIARDTATSAEASVRLTEARLRGGIAARTDLAQAQTILEQARSDIAEQLTQVAQDENALRLLVGGELSPDLLPADLAAVADTIAALPAGLDSRVLLRRPDVVQAEYGLYAANARIGAARAAFFPAISLTASLGVASTALGGLFNNNAFNYTGQGSIAQTLFDGGRLSGQLAQARAARAGALARYEGTIQAAFRDVADALARQGTIGEQLRAQAALVTAAETTLRLGEARYRGGIDPYLNLLDAQRTLYAARRSFVATQLTAADSRVTLYRVLGGDTLAPVAAQPDAALPRVDGAGDAAVTSAPSRRSPRSR